MRAVLTGLDRVRRDGLPLPGEGRVAVLCNATTVAADWTPTVNVLWGLPGVRVERILSPQHGFASEKQDNMISSEDTVHPRLGIPIISLYGKKRAPGPADLADIDALVIDLQDVGTRVYTFLSTAVITMGSALERGLPVVLLDRPNPIGGRIGGPLLGDEFVSFVGMVPVPLRHGLTAGEFCRFAAQIQDLPTGDDALRVIALENWSRTTYYDDSGLPWTMPSPNMPTLATALVYPGQVVLEGTVLSEGRGTTRPFELFGAPWLDPAAVVACLRGADLTPDSDGSTLAGAHLREVDFEPTFHKFATQRVRGFQLHPLDRARFDPIAATTTLLWAIRQVHGALLAWREPPYEYEWERLPVDLIYGTDIVRRSLEDGRPPREIIGAWREELPRYQEQVAPHLIYGPLDAS